MADFVLEAKSADGIGAPCCVNITNLRSRSAKLCTNCGKKIKIMTFVTHPEHIRRVLMGIGWPVTIPEFDQPQKEHPENVCQLVSHTFDGFAEPEEQVHYDAGPDPPSTDYIDSPHCEYECDSPHWED